MTTSGVPPEDKAGGLENEPDDQLKRIPVLWEEYKYRHDLCWRVMFRLTSAVVILAIVPYVYQEVVQGLPKWVLWAPASLAVLLAGFAFLLMSNELEIFEEIKEEYRNLKINTLYVDDAEKHASETSRLRQLVYGYLTILTLLSMINVFVVVTELPR